MTLLAVYDGSDTLVARFEYGVGRMPVRMTQDSETYYFAYDQVGSLRVVFDDAGVLVHEITYDSYGNIITDETTSGFGSVYIPPFGFAGGLHDRDTGMVLFGFRDYDPETGTWLTPDPIGFAGGDTYLYGYCGGDPVNFSDPSGLQYHPWTMQRAFAESVTGIVSNVINSNAVSVADMTFGWATGLGESRYFFDEHSSESKALADSPIVAKAWDYFLDQNAGQSCNEMRKVTDIIGDFWTSEFAQATMNMDIIEHFVGSARVDIYPNNAGVATIVVTNTTSMTSALKFLLRDKGPAWEQGNRWLPFGNIRQTYTFKREIPKSKIR